MTIQDVMRRVLAYGGAVALAIAVVCGIGGFAIAGWTGVVTALVACAAAVAFVALTALSVGIAFAVARGVAGVSQLAFAVLGGILAKAALFVVLLIATRDQPWLAHDLMLWMLLLAVLGALLVDVLLLVAARRPIAEEAPEDETLGRPARR